MKKCIIAIIFILGITPSYNGNGIELITNIEAQISGSEFWEDNEICEGDYDIYCIGCEECYDSSQYSTCPNCGPALIQCEKCKNQYNSGDDHDCSDDSDSSSGSTRYPYCPKCKQYFWTINDRTNHHCPYYQ